MKKLIFSKIYKDIGVFFLSSLFLLTIIVWTIQAVSYFDFVTEDGHGLSVYVYYTIFNFPKILTKILPYVYFISIFYILIMYELKNELIIFWINGISKIKFANRLIFFSIILMLLQIVLKSYISPMFQYKARNLLKNSNIDLFSSLIQEGKFVNATKGLTIFINNINYDGTYNDIYIDDSRNSKTRVIYSNSGYLVNTVNNKLFKLNDGKIIDFMDDNVNSFKFDQIELNLGNLDTNTIVVPKLQEIDTKTLFSCYFNLSKLFNELNCQNKLLNEIKVELIERIYKPIYIPLITLICCFIVLESKNSKKFKKIYNTIFVLAIIIFLIAEFLVSYSVKSNFYTIVYILLPLTLLILAYIIYRKISENV
jgi:lipopolysaccharide export system permease protein